MVPFRRDPKYSRIGAGDPTRLAVDVASPETNVAIINGHAYFKSDAMILVLAGLPGWSWSRIFLLLPRRVRDWPMTGSRATGIACLAGTRAVSSRHRRSPLVLCSTTHRGSSRDKSHPGRRRKASKSLCHSVPHLAQLPSPTYQWVLTGLPGSTLLALGVLREGPTFTALSVFLHGDRGFESVSLHRRVTANPLFTNLSEGTKARACKEVQSTRSSKTPSPQAAFAGKLPATSFAKSGIARAKARPGRELTKRGSQRGANLALARRSSLKSEQCSPWR